MLQLIPSLRSSSQRIRLLREPEWFRRYSCKHRLSDWRAASETSRNSDIDSRANPNTCTDHTYV